jgi:hypothetical protein
MKCGLQNILHLKFVDNMDAHILSVFVWKENPIDMKCVTKGSLPRGLNPSPFLNSPQLN